MKLKEISESFIEGDNFFNLQYLTNKTIINVIIIKITKPLKNMQKLKVILSFKIFTINKIETCNIWIKKNRMNYI